MLAESLVYPSARIVVVDQGSVCDSTATSVPQASAVSRASASVGAEVTEQSGTSSATAVGSTADAAPGPAMDAVSATASTPLASRRDRTVLPVTSNAAPTAPTRTFTTEPP